VIGTQSQLPERLFDLSGQVAIVTGGAGRVGFQLCMGLATAGASVVLTSRDINRCQAAVTALRDRSFEVQGVLMDVTNENSVGEAQSIILEKSGRVDILVNNAGIASKFSVEDVPLSEWERVLRVNITGTLICSRAFAPCMIAQRAGSIINISSIYGVVSPDHRIYGHTERNSSLVYGATKGAIIQMTKYMAVHWAGKGIRVNCISLGGVQFDQEPEFVQSYGGRVPLGRMAAPRDLWGAAVFLASKDASYVTGQNLIVDGGWTTW